MKMRSWLPMLLVPVLLAKAGPVQAATLAEALGHWIGTTPDVVGAGEAVKIVLPPGSPIPSVTAHAHPATHGGEQGWQLDAITLPVPFGLPSGAKATAAHQHASGWAGAATADFNGAYDGLVLVNRGKRSRIDHAHVVVAASLGPVSLAVDIVGVHGDDPTVEPLLPHRMVVRGHTTNAGVRALAAMTQGQHGAAAPVTLDTLSFDAGPARFSAAGSVIIEGPGDRRGQMHLSVVGLGELMQSMTTEGKIPQLYAGLMVLRSLGRKENGALQWDVVFAGSKVLVDGIDVGGLLGLQ